MGDAPPKASDDAAEQTVGLDVFLDRPDLPAAEVDAELALCQALRSWNPWEAPGPEVIAALGALSQLAVSTATGVKCLVRSQALQDLAYEEAHFATLPEKLKYHAAARWRLQKQAVGVEHRQRARAIVDHVEAHAMLDLKAIAKRLAEPCEKHGLQHHCLDVFRSNLALVRNWQVPPASVPTAPCPHPCPPTAAFGTTCASCSPTVPNALFHGGRCSGGHYPRLLGEKSC